MPDRTSCKLFVLSGPAEGKTFPLLKEALVLGRPDECSGWKPDIDLSPDYSVSRKHARISFADGQWWVEDMGSRHGTVIEGKRITKPARLSPGAVVGMGESSWVFDHADKTHVIRGDLVIGFRSVPAVNYALYHCGIPAVSDLTILNRGAKQSGPVHLAISLRGYSDEWEKRIDPLPGGKGIVVGRVHLPLHYEKLEGNAGSRKGRIELRVDGELVSAERVSILGFYHWPLDRAFRTTLACFIEPSHPLVRAITLDAGVFMKGVPRSWTLSRLLETDREDRVDIALEALYECLASDYRIGYLPPPPNPEPEYQVIRPVQRIISDARGKRGGGTCIDTTLLFASCLESLGLQPLVIVTRQPDGSHHAFLGCWRSVSQRYESLLSDAEKIRKAALEGAAKKLLLLETTGITDRFARRLSYSQAARLAEEGFAGSQFLYALDVSAARQTVAPLEMPMSPEALEIVRSAEEYARSRESDRLETLHLLAALFQHEGEAGRLLAEMGIGPPDEGILSEVSGRPRRRGNAGPLRPTINYRRVLEDAKSIACDAGVTYIDEKHLLYAILFSRSGHVDRFLEKLGTDRRALRKAFEQRYRWTAAVVQTRSEA